MGLFDIFRTKDDAIEIVSKRPVAKFKVEKVFEIFGREILVGEVVEGVIYPGYKIKGNGAALIREIQKDNQRVDFALAYDEVALSLEGRTNAKVEDILEVYQS